MSRRELLVVRILLLVARIVASDEGLRQEIQHLANHISAHMPEESATRGSATRASSSTPTGRAASATNGGSTAGDYLREVWKRRTVGGVFAVLFHYHHRDESLSIADWSDAFPP